MLQAVGAQVIIEEGMGRHITNQAMLLQLNMLRDDMHRGYYALDTFRCQSNEVVSQTLSLQSKFCERFVLLQ